MADITQLTQLTKQLIAIPSETQDRKANKTALEMIHQYLTDFPVMYFDKNDVLSNLYSNQHTKQFDILFTVHADVVPGNPEQFIPQEKDGKIYGRGAYDAKAGIAAMVFAFKETVKDINYPVGLQIVTDEEKGGYEGAEYQAQEGIRAAFVIGSEPTNFAIANKLKGCVKILIEFKGQRAHTAYPWGGHNAICRMNTFLNKFHELFPHLQKDAWKTTASPVVIGTNNTSWSMVPDNCQLGIDIRYTPEEYPTGDAVIRKVTQLLDPEATYKVHWNEPAHQTPGDNPYLVKLQQITQQTLQKEIPIIYRNGTGDIRHFAEVGSEGVEFGLIGHGHHTDNEWVSTKSIENYYKILKEFLLSYKK